VSLPQSLLLLDARPPAHPRLVMSSAQIADRCGTALWTFNPAVYRGLCLPLSFVQTLQGLSPVSAK
jgi:hypothetical protein